MHHLLQWAGSPRQPIRVTEVSILVALLETLLAPGLPLSSGQTAQVKSENSEPFSVVTPVNCCGLSSHPGCNKTKGEALTAVSAFPVISPGSQRTRNLTLKEQLGVHVAQWERSAQHTVGSGFDPQHHIHTKLSLKLKSLGS